MKIYKAIIEHRWTVLWVSLAVSLFGFLSYIQMPMKLLPHSKEKRILVLISGENKAALESGVVSKVYRETLLEQKLNTSPILNVNLDLMSSQFILDQDVTFSAIEFSRILESNLRQFQQKARVFCMELQLTDMASLRIAIRSKQQLSADRIPELLTEVENHFLPGLNQLSTVQKTEYTDGWQRVFSLEAEHFLPESPLGSASFLTQSKTKYNSTFVNKTKNVNIETNFLNSEKQENSFRWQGNNSAPQIDGRAVILIDVYRKEAASEIGVSDDVINYIEKNAHANYEALIISDDASYIRAAQENVVSNLNVGTLLTCLCVLLFVKNWRTTLIVALSIPFSILMTFPILEFLGLSRNVMSLAGIALAVGIVVDATLSVVEGALERVDKGRNLFMASVQSAFENTKAIAATSLTTLAVFVPILFLKGFVGDLFYDLAMTFIVSQIVSFFVTLFLVPALIVVVHELFAKNIFLFSNKRNTETEAENKIKGYWEAKLARLLKNPLECLAINVVFLILVALSFVIAPPSEFLPRAQTSHYRLAVSVGKNTSEKQRRNLFTVLEDNLKNQGFTERFVREDKGYIFADFVSEKLQQRKFLEQWQPLLQPYGFTIAAINPLNVAASSGRDLEFYVPIENQNRNLIKKELAKSPYITQQYWSQDHKEYLVDVSLKTESLSMPESKMNMLWSLGASKTPLGFNWYRQPGKEEFLLKKVYEPHKEEMLHPFFPILIPSHFSDVGSKLSSYPTERFFKDGQEYEKVALALEKLTTSEGESITQEVFSKFKTPLIWDETVIRNNQGMAQLLSCIGIAFILIFLILWIQNRSAVMAMVVMFTFIWGPIGAFPGLRIHGEVLNGSVLVGFILLAGTIVNNGILLVEIIQRYRMQQREPIDCCLMAIKERSVPVIVTALTTVFGMLPMVFETGEGSQMYRGLSIIVVYGTLLSTPISLIGIPSLVMILDYSRERFFRALLRSRVLVAKPISFYLKRGQR